ncbi:unnamed protein product [Peniophora sp. CBMAI 1063]|nr:unnamed protein product [Peniophora sp. CBMAI 1063]
MVTRYSRAECGHTAIRLHLRPATIYPTNQDACYDPTTRPARPESLRTSSTSGGRRQLPLQHPYRAAERQARLPAHQASEERWVLEVIEGAVKTVFLV